MTFEKIMEIFKEQFEIDKDIEVAKFRRGYQIFIWDSKQGYYIPNDTLLQSTDELFNELLEETRNFYELKYKNSETGKTDDIHRFEIEKIISKLKNAYKAD